MTKRFSLKPVMAIGLLAAVAGLSFSAQAAQSHCSFTSGNGTQMMSWGALGAVNVQASVSSPTQIGNVAGYKAGHVVSQCDDAAATDARSLWVRFNPAVVTAGSVTSTQGKETPLIATSVPGIAYTLALVSSTGITVDTATSASADWRETDKYEASQLDGANWNYVIKLYQLPAFKLGSASEVTTRNENVESVLLGAPATDAASSLNLQSGTGGLSFLLNSPTCQTAVLAPGSHVSGNQLQLGDYYMSELKPGRAPKAIPFALNFTGCAGTTTITAKLSSNYVSNANPELLAQSNGGGATGVGVKIEGTEGTVTLIPNDQQSFYSQSDNNMSDSRQLGFNAYLMADGNPLTSGEFKTTATFNLTYD